MAQTGFVRTQLPFINQSIARSLRSGAFRSKTQVGPQTAEAIARGALKGEREVAVEQAGLFARIAENKRQADQSASLETQKLVESARQFDATRTLGIKQLQQQKEIFDANIKLQENIAATARRDARRAAEKAKVKWYNPYTWF